MVGKTGAPGGNPCKQKLDSGTFLLWDDSTESMADGGGTTKNFDITTVLSYFIHC